MPTKEPNDRRLAALDLSWISPEIALSGSQCLNSGTQFLVEDLGITHIVDLRAEASHDKKLLAEAQIEVLELPTLDNTAVDQCHLSTGVKWVTDALDNKKKVLIHCTYGIGRSVLLCCCVLVSLGYTPVESLELIKRARQKASPSPDQLYAFVKWSENWYKKNSLPFPPTDWEMLAEIAQRH